MGDRAMNDIHQTMQEINQFHFEANPSLPILITSNV